MTSETTDELTSETIDEIDEEDNENDENDENDALEQDQSIYVDENWLINETDEKHLRDILSEIYFTDDDDSLKFCALDAFARVVFHSTLLIIDQTIVIRNDDKSVLSTNISNND